MAALFDSAHATLPVFMICTSISNPISGRRYPHFKVAIPESVIVTSSTSSLMKEVAFMIFSFTFFGLSLCFGPLLEHLGNRFLHHLLILVAIFVQGILRDTAPN